MFDFQDVATYGVEDFALNAIIYAAMTAPVFFLLWVFFKDKLKLKRIQLKQKNTNQGIRNELKHSASALFIIALIDVCIYVAQKHGYTKIYDNVGQYGWGYLLATVPVLVLVHDTWFYFTHRLVHHPKLYKYVHKVHHESTDPSPFAAFAFHPTETVVETGIYIIVPFIFPVNFYALLVWQLLQMADNVYAHCGYELFPAGFTKHWLFKHKTASTHHNMHHARFNGNYGLYFTWWDKICGTEFKDYHQSFEAIHARKEAAPLQTEKQPVVMQEAEA